MTTFTVGSGYPGEASIKTKLAYLLRYGIEAPSPQNTQPWALRVNDDSIDVMLDPARQLTVGDPEARESIVSVGMVVHHLETAIRAHGMIPVVRYFPEYGSSPALARVSVTGEAAATADAIKLFEQISLRHTAARFRPDTDVSAGVLADLEAATHQYGCGLRWVDRGPFRSSVAALIQEADELMFSGRRFREEFASWVRRRVELTGDGVSADAFGLSGVLAPLAPWLIEHLDYGRLTGKDDFARAVAAPALGVLFTRADSVAEWMDAGRALSHVVLLASQMGYGCALFDQPMESNRMRGRLAALLQTDSAPQALVRIGVEVPSTAVTTPRRPVESFDFVPDDNRPSVR